ncbi:MAG: ABC transporter ATP-binding protein [bacterium]|nr:ABC transporter ATP-binding protein [bacterium]
MLEVQHLTKLFDGIKAVDDCSFSVAQGKITALIGPNGAGKTTILNCISGIERIDKGNILYEHQDVSHWRDYERAEAGIARTFQLPRIFKNLTVYENVSLSVHDRDQDLIPSFFGFNRLKEEDEKKIANTLAHVKLSDMGDTVAQELSYGQQKLLSLARALLQPHRLLMLDEPVAGVNPALRQEFVTLFKRLRDEGETMLVVEHDMDFAMEIADWVVVMNEGKVLKKGTPVEVRNDREVLKVYSWK